MRPGLASLALVAGSVSLLWFRFNAPPSRVGLIFPFDLVFYYLPMAELAVERLWSGELPLWNPYACSGIPLLATLQVGVFYPPNWLSGVIPPESAIPCLVFAEVVAGGWFFALFLRATGRGEMACALGGIVFAFSCLLGQSFWPPQVSTLLWLPWHLLCVERLVRAASARWWAALAGGVALQLLAGFPQFVVYGACLVCPYAALRLREEARAGRRRPVEALRTALLAGLAVLLGAGLAAVQLLPTLELVAQSARTAPLAAADQLYLGPSLPAGAFLLNSLDPTPKLMTFGFGAATGYVGLATLSLLGLGILVGRRDPITWLWVLAGGLGLLLSTGPFGAGSVLDRFTAALPVGGFFRTPERLQLLPLFAASILAAAGFDALSRGLGRPWERRAALVLGFGVVACAASFGAAGSLPRAIAAAALIGVATRSGRWRPAAALAPALLLALLVADLALATGAHGSLRRLPVDWARSLNAEGQVVLAPAAAAALGGDEGRDRVTAVGTLPFAGSGPLRHLHRVECYEPLAPRAWSELAGATGKRDIFAAGWTLDPERFPAFYDVVSAQRFVRVLRRPRNRTDERAFRRRLRRQMRELRPSPGPRGDLVVEIAENPDALPRAYFVEGFTVVPDGDDVKRVLHGDFDYRRRVLLDFAPDGLVPVADPPPARAARITSYAPERLEVEVEAPGAGVLVLADTFYPGWRARVDDRPADILRANGLFRAVLLPPGNHRVSFEYAPASLRNGAALSLGSLALLFALLSARGPFSHRPARSASG